MDDAIEAAFVNVESADAARLASWKKAEELAGEANRSEKALRRYENVNGTIDFANSAIHGGLKGYAPYLTGVTGLVGLGIGALSNLQSDNDGKIYDGTTGMQIGQILSDGRTVMTDPAYVNPTQNQIQT